MISSIPVVAGPSLPPQPPPPGYTMYKKHGWWGNPTLKDVCDIDTCGKHCDAAAGCLAFEVYLTDVSQPGNCYLFNDINIEFTSCLPCQTYIKTNRIKWPEPRSMAEHVALRSRYPSVSVKQQHPTASIYASILKESQEGTTSVSGTTSLPGTTSLLSGTTSLLSGTPSLAAAWTALMGSISDLGNVELFRFDLVDVARAVIAKSFASTFALYNLAFSHRDLPQTTQLSISLLSIIDDYDLLLSSNENFMVGRWIQWARTSIPNASTALQDHLEFNARNQITLWGPNGEINDYAKKEWGGLVSSYYKKRYEVLFSMVKDVLHQGNASTWNQNVYQSNVMKEVSLPWSNDTTVFPSVPDEKHDLLVVIEKLHKKYVQN